MPRPTSSTICASRAVSAIASERRPSMAGGTVPWSGTCSSRARAAARRAESLRPSAMEDARRPRPRPPSRRRSVPIAASSSAAAIRPVAVASRRGAGVCRMGTSHTRVAAIGVAISWPTTVAAGAPRASLHRRAAWRMPVRPRQLARRPASSAARASGHPVIDSPCLRTRGGRQLGRQRITAGERLVEALQRRRDPPARSPVTLATPARCDSTITMVLKASWRSKCSSASASLRVASLKRPAMKCV